MRHLPLKMTSPYTLDIRLNNLILSDRFLLKMSFKCFKKEKLTNHSFSYNRIFEPNHSSTIPLQFINN